MKTCCRVPSPIILAMLFLISCLSFANATEYSSVFAEDLAIHYGSELFIYAEAQIIEPQETNYFDQIVAVNLHYSFDMGANWQQHTIPVPSHQTWIHKPVLSKIDGFVILSIGNSRYKITHSEGALLTEELPDANYALGTDLAPYPFMLGGEEHLFKVDQPYPERIQYEFTKDGTTDIRNLLYGDFCEQDRSMNDTTVYWTLTNSLDAPVCNREDILIPHSNAHPGMFQAPVMCGG